MTKHLLLLLLCLLGLLSCQESAEQRTLQQAAELVFHQPDSALTLLQQIPSPEQLPAKTFADYSLLMTEALDRSYHPLPDTLLRVAADYYLERKDNPVQTAKTCYYLGRFNMETGYAKEAQSFYMKGIEVLKEEKEEYRLKGLLYGYLGDLYREQKLYEEAITQHKKSYRFSLLIDNTEDIIFDLRNIGIDFSNYEIPDSAIFYYTEALSIAREYVQSVPDKAILIGSLYQDLAVCYQHKKEYDKALYYSSLSYPYAPKDFVSINDLTRGTIFMDMQHVDSAYYYLNRSLHSIYNGIQAESYQKLYLLEKQQKHFEKATYYCSLYLSKRDSIEQTRQTEVLANIDKRYQYEQIINRNKDLVIKLHRAKGNLYLWLFIASVMFVSLGFAYAKMKRRKEMQLKMQKSYSNEILKNLEQTQAAISKQEQHLKLLHNQEFNFRKQQFEETEAYKRIKQSIDQMNCTLSKEDEKEIISTVDKLFNTFPEKLKALNITQGNLCFCYILKLFPELRNDQLAQMYNVSLRSIEQRKYRLKKELVSDEDKKLGQFLEEL